MPAMPAVHPMTAEEYVARPYDPSDRGAELIGGELVADEPILRHELVCLEILRRLTCWSRQEAGRGLVTLPIDVLIGEHDVYGPDVLWYRDGRAPGRDDPRPYPVPDLAVEVRSPRTWRFDIGVKKTGYERSALPELWLVDTAAAVVLVFRRSAAAAAAFDVALELACDDELTSPLLPGFRVRVDDLFG
jgi:Uma2 family endonuclease